MLAAIRGVAPCAAAREERRAHRRPPRRGRNDGIDRIARNTPAGRGPAPQAGRRRRRRGRAAAAAAAPPPRRRRPPGRGEHLAGVAEHGHVDPDARRPRRSRPTRTSPPGSSRYIIDAVIMGVAFGILYSIFLALFLSSALGGFGFMTFVWFVVLLLIYAAGSAIYFIYTWTKMRGSPGQRVHGPRDAERRRRRGRSPSPRRSGAGCTCSARRSSPRSPPSCSGCSGRSSGLLVLAYEIFLLYTAANSPTRQGFHDVQASTVVVKVTEVGSPRPRRAQLAPNRPTPRSCGRGVVLAAGDLRASVETRVQRAPDRASAPPRRTPASRQPVESGGPTSVSPGEAPPGR